MKQWIESVIARFWNRVIMRRKRPIARQGLDLGARVSEDGVRQGQMTIPHARRAEHLAVLGKTGSGKSSFLRYLLKQDIEAGRGFIVFDLHGDMTSFVMSTVAARERVLGEDLSQQLIIVSPADADHSAGLNPLESGGGANPFVLVAEITEVLRKRAHLESFGPRTDELLRNSVFVLAECGLTLVELAPFLADSNFRSGCLKRISNPEIKGYFELRYDQASAPMQGQMREPILNKIGTLVSDPYSRHIIGQRSTFPLRQAMDRKQEVVFYLPKSKLGEVAATLASLFLTPTKNAVFSRTSRELFPIYADELPNLISAGTDLETLLQESRKFGAAVHSSNQILDQLPPEMRSAILAVGTLACFQLASADAQLLANAFDGGKALAELLKNLPQRHAVVKTGSERWHEIVVPTVTEPKVDFSDLHERCRKRWTRSRNEIEKEIVRRQAALGHQCKEALNDWE